MKNEAKIVPAPTRRSFLPGSAYCWVTEPRPLSWNQRQGS